MKVSIKLYDGELKKVHSAIFDLQRIQARYIKRKGLPVSQIAKALNDNVNRVRYIVDALIEQGYIRKILIKDSGRFHRRYIFEEVKQWPENQ